MSAEVLSLNYSIRRSRTVSFLIGMFPERAPQSAATPVFGVLKENGGQLRRSGKHFAQSCAHTARSSITGCAAVTKASA
jgi:hypothetical protein